MIDPSRLLLNLAGRVSVRYALSFIVVVFVAAGLASSGFATIVADLLRWLLFGVGLSCLTFAGWLVGHAILRQPELLRSEDHQLVGHVLKWIQTLDIDDDVKLRASEKPIAGLLQQSKATKPNVSQTRPPDGAAR